MSLARRCAHGGWLALLLCVAAAGAERIGEKEAALRAAFLYRLAFFVDWVPASFPAADSPLRFCVVAASPSPVANLLRTHTRERQVAERTVEVEQRAPGSALDGCHLVYLERAAEHPASPSPGQLVVVDSLDGLEHGGTLALLAQHDASQQSRLGFVSRRDLLAGSGVALSARLLQLVRFEDDGSLR